MPRRERPAKSNQNGGSDDDPAVVVAEIPRKSAPLRRRVLQPRSRGHDNLVCEPTRSGPRSALMGSSAKDTNRISDASIVRVHGSLGLQTPVNGNNSRNFRPRSKNEIPRKSAHDCSLKEKRDHPPRMMMPSWETCEGDRLLGLQPTWRRAAILGISLLSRQDRPAVDAASSRGCPIFDALVGPREA